MCFDLINTSAFPKLCKTFRVPSINISGYDLNCMFIVIVFAVFFNNICTFFCCPNKHNHFQNIKFIVCCFRHSTENNQQCFHSISSLSPNLQA